MSLYTNLTWSLQAELLLPPVLRDLAFTEENDDFKFGEGDNAAISYIILSSPGHWKEFPALGVGIFKYLHSTSTPAEIERAIRIQLKSDIFNNAFVDAKGFPEIIVNKLRVRLND